MSCTEIHVGELHPVDLSNYPDGVIQFMKEELHKNSIDFANEDDEDIMDDFYGEFYNEYYYDKTTNKLYKVVNDKEFEDGEDLSEFDEMPNGNIKYVVSYYNGGCCFDEALTYGMDKLNRDKQKEQDKEELLGEQEILLEYLNTKLENVQGECTKQRYRDLINYVETSLKILEDTK